MASSSSPSSPSVRNYDVFLSFRGEDTRRNIVSYLYEALCREGIVTFRDDQRLQIGDKISEQLVEAIKTSRFAVVVISKNYATSTWCLDELQLVMELHRENRIQVVPIFYEVEPSNVRHQTGSFKAAFQRYKNLYTAPERVSQWRSALNQVSHLSGFHSRTSLDEATMISNTVRSVSSQLMEMRQTSAVDLVGMEAHMVKMHFLLNMGSESEVLIIGIWGMGGIGKTTIAEHLYDRFSRNFSAHYFIEDIKKNYKGKSPSYLTEIFLSRILHGQHFGFQSNKAGSQEIKARLGHQKVFVVLDGVDKAEQIHALAKETSWFGPGSRIIITTRDRGLLYSCGVDSVHEVKCLDDKDALQVFQKFAFGGRSVPSDGFEQLFIRASRLAHGLPSALVAYASYLSENKTTLGWENKLRILEKIPHQNVEEILRTSYDGLDYQDKMAFLHVACFFNGYFLNHIRSFLDNGYHRLEQLIEKSLINASTDGYANMHFLVVQTGREIVRQESRNRPCKQRLLWDHEEIYDVLENNTGTDETEGVTLHMCEMPNKLPMSFTVFNCMPSIRFLKFFQHLGGAESNVQLSQDGFHFTPKLRLLHWDVYPLKSLPSRFQYHHLVELNLRYSNLVSLWDTTVNLPKLRRLDVTGSKNLTELPDFSTANRLEELIVEGCINLRKIPDSLFNLCQRTLTKLNATHCDILSISSIVDFVDIGDSWQTAMMVRDKKVWFYNCEDLSIEGQICIRSIGFRGQTQHLSIGYDQYQSATMERESVRPRLGSQANKSKSLEIKQFSYMEDRSSFCCNNFSNFRILAHLKLINLNIERIPDDICHLQLLETLDLSGNDFEYLPTKMGQLAKLKYLNLQNCRRLTALPQLAQVETLILSDCVNLLELHVEEEVSPYLLLELWLDNCNNVQGLSHYLRRLTKLAYLDLSRNDYVTVPAGIIDLSVLGTLCLNNCKKLKSLEELPVSLKHLYAHGCDSLENVDLSPNHSIEHLDFIDCPHLNLEEHKHFKDLLSDEEHCQKGSQQCAGSPETVVILENVSISSDLKDCPLMKPDVQLKTLFLNEEHLEEVSQRFCTLSRTGEANHFDHEPTGTTPMTIGKPLIQTILTGNSLSTNKKKKTGNCFQFLKPCFGRH